MSALGEVLPALRHVAGCRSHARHARRRCRHPRPAARRAGERARGAAPASPCSSATWSDRPRSPRGSTRRTSATSSASTTGASSARCGRSTATWRCCWGTAPSSTSAYPHGHEDNAARAVRAALALVAEVGKLTVLDQALRVRIGVATGMVVVGDMTDGDSDRERTALGETPNLAARLQALAEPDTVVIAGSTVAPRPAIRFTYRDLGAFPIKGFAAPVQVWKVMGTAPAADAFATLRPDGETRPGERRRVVDALVGREQEPGLLRDCWEQVAEGRGRVVLVMGDSGIGKTRLVQTLVAEVAEQPHVLARARAAPRTTRTARSTP
ncbi:MAG: AAA family ATPase [Chromatiales bacterium]|nr:AAA family ATPase [Chromatiales bacterium]